MIELNALSFRPAATTISQDWPALARHLRELGLAFDPAQSVRQFAGGLGNLNYLVEIDGVSWVLRRPPLGPIPPGANDMAREHRILSALFRTFALAPRSLTFCADAAVLGAPFLVIEFKPGLIVRDRLPAKFDSTAVGPKLCRMLIDVLAKLHAIEPAAVGLADLGKPDGFLARAVEGWAKRAIIANDGAMPIAAAAIVSWLRGQRVPAGSIALLHNDFKLDNIILDPATLTPRAVIDWDMGTRGDPLFDLATLLSYWTEASDPPCMHRLRQMPTALSGFASRTAMIAAYAAATGRDVSDFQFYRVLTMFKLGVVFLQLGAQWRRGATIDPRYKDFSALGDDLLYFTREIAMGRAV